MIKHFIYLYISSKCMYLQYHRKGKPFDIGDIQEYAYFCDTKAWFKMRYRHSKKPHLEDSNGDKIWFTKYSQHKNYESYLISKTIQ